MPSLERWRRLSGRPGGGSPKKARNKGVRGARGRGGGRKTTTNSDPLAEPVSWALFDEPGNTVALTTSVQVQAEWSETARGGTYNFFTGASLDEVVIPAGVSFIGINMALQIDALSGAYAEAYLIRNPAGANDLLLRSRTYDSATISVGCTLIGRRIAVSEGDILQIRVAGQTGKNLTSFTSMHWSIWDDGALLSDLVA